MDTFLFDIGNVIMHFDFTHAGARLAKVSSAEGDPLKLLAPLKQKLESGQIDGPEFVAKGIEKIGFGGTPEEFTTIWEEVFSPNQPMWDSLGKIKGNYRLLLLSNTSDIHKDSLFRDFSIFDMFEGGTYSFSAQSEKPEPEIYKAAIDEFGIDPANTLYVDDLQENIDAGIAAGLVSHHYHPDHHDAFLEVARGYGFAL